MIDYWIPQATTAQKHPLYRLEMRRRRKEEPLEIAIKRNLMRVSILCGALVGFWLFICLNRAYQFYTREEKIPDTIFTAGDAVLVWLLIIGIGANLGLDFGAVLVSVEKINQERTTGHWQLLSLTHFWQAEIIAIKHTVAQTQVLPVALLIVGVRIAAVLMVFIRMVGGYLLIEGFPRLEMLPCLTLFFPLLLLLLYLAIRLAVAYCVEPLWRLRAVTAIGVAISARVQGAALSLLAGLGAVALLWFCQGVVLVILEQIFVSSLNNNWSQFYGVFGCLGIPAVLGIYLYYNFLRVWGLRRAAQDAFRE